MSTNSIHILNVARFLSTSNPDKIVGDKVIITNRIEKIQSSLCIEENLCKMGKELE